MRLSGHFLVAIVVGLAVYLLGQRLGLAASPSRVQAIDAG